MIFLQIAEPYAAPDRLPKSAAPLNGYRLKEMPGFRPPGERLRHEGFMTLQNRLIILPESEKTRDQARVYY